MLIRFTLKTPAKAVQEKFLSIHLEELDRKVNTSTILLRKIPYSIMSIADINKFLSANGINFVDFEFTPADASLFSPMVDTSNFDTVIHWRRPEEFMVVDESRGLRKPTVFYDTIDPSDLKQGVLGDCWFMSALATIAERPSLVERLFVTKEFNPNGVYRVKLCKNGEWVTVTVDDYFPCFPLGGPIFSRNHGNELWALILEKAYAKLQGSYFSLRGGYASEALLDLTGCPTFTMVFDEEDVKNKVENNTLWEDIKGFEEEGYLLSVSTPGEDRWADQGWGDDEESSGLSPGHAYTILQVKDYKQNKLVCLRNPWGNFEWKGDWGAHSTLWTDEIKQIIKPNLTGDDGSWWISYEDLIKNFYCLNVCKVRNWDEVRIKGKFIKIQEIDDPDIEITLSKWYYSMEIMDKTKVVISLHQEDERVAGVALNRPYLDISLVVLRRLRNNQVELVDFADFKFERQVHLELELESGSYIVLPRSTGCTLKKAGDLAVSAVPLLDRMGGMTETYRSVVVDVFRKFDMLLNRELSFVGTSLFTVEFKGFFECLNKSISEDDFRKDILKNYASSTKGISQMGFLQFWLDKTKQLGEETMYGWLENLGYDRSLHSIRSRSFLLNIHRYYIFTLAPMKYLQ
jgi:calpain-15